MADNEKDNVPIKEREDGSVLASVGTHPDDVLDDNEAEEKAEGGSVDEDHTDGEHDDSEASADDGDGDETEEERERIREARREERRLKKALQK